MTADEIKKEIFMKSMVQDFPVFLTTDMETMYSVLLEQGFLAPDEYADLRVLPNGNHRHPIRVHKKFKLNHGVYNVNVLFYINSDIYNKVFEQV